MRTLIGARWIVILCLAVAFVAGSSASVPAQYSRRAPLPPPPAPPSHPVPDPRYLTPQTYGRACVTPWGICPLPGWVAPGTPCNCFVPSYSTYVAGHAREWAWYFPSQTP